MMKRQLAALGGRQQRWQKKSFLRTTDVSLLRSSSRRRRRRRHLLPSSTTHTPELLQFLENQRCCFPQHVSVPCFLHHHKQHVTVRCFSSKVLLVDQVDERQDDQEEHCYYDGDDNDDDEDEDASVAQPSDKLEALEFKNYDISYLRTLQESGELVIQPFFQRGYKWTQDQASIWIESILRGYPCLPEVTLLRTTEEDGREQFAVFDGQQRLTSTIFFIANRRSDKWKMGKNNNDVQFRLKNLTIFKDLEGKRFQDLSVKEQNRIKKFDVRCAIIPSSWSMHDYMDFFKKIQSGGTPMTPQELQRALTHGPFTDLLDRLVEDDVVKQAFRGIDGLDTEIIHRHLLRYYQYRLDPQRFGKPSLLQNGFETMKHYKRLMGSWTGEEFYKYDELVNPLKKSLQLISCVFHENEPFRRPVPISKGDSVASTRQPNKVWMNSGRLNSVIWDCTVATFAREDIRKEEKAVRVNAEAIRNALIELMQTHPAFTESLKFQGISGRIHLFATEIVSIIEDSSKPSPKRIPAQVRRDLIQAARVSGALCNLCGLRLGPYDDLLHIDHKHPLSKGGTNDLDNLQVVHKSCNLQKYNKVETP